MSHRTLHISDSLSLPLDVATQALAFIARRGAGKTYAASKLCELLLDAGVQCVVLDSVGNWYGLRLAKNGRDRGFDIPVIGGLRGDIPLQSTGGELIADIVVDTGRSLILDISQFSLGDRRRFATQFGQRLWQRKKGESHPSPLMLVIEESQLIVPQKVDSGSAQMVGIYEEIIRLGRNYGIGCTMISQRPQSVNKEVLNQTECLFVGQVNGAQERKALREWIAYQGMDPKLTDELPSLAVGTMYVWSPQWLQILKKVEISGKQTYDASATPRVGEKRVARELKPLNLDDLREKMSATIERAKQEDPRELRRQIADLRKQISVKAASQPIGLHTVVDNTKVIQAAVQKAIIDRDREWAAKFKPLEQEYQKSCRILDGILKLIGGESKRTRPVIEMPSKAKVTAPPKPAPKPVLSISTGVIRDAPEKSSVNGKLRSGAERMLSALVQWSPEGMLEGQMRSHAGMKKSGTFSTYMSDLRRGGYMELRDGKLFATQAGIDYFGGDVPTAPNTTADVLAVWEPKLRAGAVRILRELVAKQGEPVDLGTLAEASGMATSGTFSTYLSDLRTARLIVTEKGTAKANAETLFL